MSFQGLLSEPVLFSGNMMYELQDCDISNLLAVCTFSKQPPCLMRTLNLQQRSLPLQLREQLHLLQEVSGHEPVACTKKFADGKNRYESRQGSQKGIQSFISKKQHSVETKSSSISLPLI